MVSELMLQQTTVAAVVPLYLRWMERFPDVATLAKASSDQVMEYWSGLGYYQRAKRLHQTALLLHEMPHPPERLEDLLALPGLGPYTAAAIASIALQKPHLALDTNALRVLLRLYGRKERADSSSVQDSLRRQVESSLPHSDFGITNQAIMELGATICKVRAPACLYCPLADDCIAHAQAIEETIPVPKPKKAVKQTPATVTILSRNGAVLLLRGTSLGLLSDLYQPPIDFFSENSSEMALTTLLEKLRTDDATNSVLADLSYSISGRKLHLSIKESAQIDDTLAASEHLDLELVWWRPGDSLALSSLTRKILSVWAESRATLQEPDDTSQECELLSEASAC